MGQFGYFWALLNVLQNCNEPSSLNHFSSRADSASRMLTCILQALHEVNVSCS